MRKVIVTGISKTLFQYFVRFVTYYTSPLLFDEKVATIYIVFLYTGEKTQERKVVSALQQVFIINPVAGKKDASHWLVPAIQQAASLAGMTPEILCTEYAGQARQLTEKLARSGQEVHIYACGGDGTLNEVLQAAAGQETVAVGCVPCGSGNDFVRNFGAAEDFLDMNTQLQAVPVVSDALQTNLGVGVDICAAGVDAQVAYGIPKFRRLPGCGGTMAYSLSIVQAMLSPFGHRLRLSIDGEEHTGTYMMMAVCNGRLYGGGYMAAPYARMDDGLLDVVLVKPMSRLRIASVLALYREGKHLREDGTVLPSLTRWMSVCRAHRVSLDVLDSRPIVATLDGECRPVRHLDIENVPGRLRLLLPPTVLKSQTVLAGVDPCMAGDSVPGREKNV